MKRRSRYGTALLLAAIVGCTSVAGLDDLLYDRGQGGSSSSSTGSMSSTSGGAGGVGTGGDGGVDCTPPAASAIDGSTLPNAPVTSIAARPATGEVVIVGKFRDGQLAIDDQLWNKANPSSDDFEVFVAHFKRGGCDWLTGFGNAPDSGVGAVVANGVAVDPATGHIVVTGSFTGSVAFGPGAGLKLDAGATTSAFVAKLDGSDGSVLWAQAFGSTSTAEGLAVAVGPPGSGLAVTGKFTGKMTLDDSKMLSNPSSGDDKMFVAKLDDMGGLVWATTDGLAKHSWGNAVAMDTDGNIFVAGRFDDQGLGALDTGDSGDLDAFVAKLKDGVGFAPEVVWAWRVHHESDIASKEEALALALDADGDALVLVSTTSTSGNLAMTDDVSGDSALGPVGGERLLLAKINQDGSLEWHRRLGDGMGPIANRAGITLDPCGRVTIVSSVSGTADFGDGGVSGGSGSDAFAAQYDIETGDPLWSQRFSLETDPNSQTGDAVGLAAGQTIVVGGTCNGSIAFAPGAIKPCADAGGGFYAWVTPGP